MAIVRLSKQFKKKFSKTPQALRERVLKQIKKLHNHPFAGKPMRFSRKRTRELYVGSYRLSYILDGEEIFLIDFYHKDEQ